MDGTKYKIYLINRDTVGKTNENGNHFRFLTGFATYDGKAIMPVVGNWLTNPKEGKKPWISIQESLSRDEKGEGMEPEQIGFFTINQGDKADSVRCVVAKMFGLKLPLSGWLNEKEIEGDHVVTTCLSYSASDYDYWADKLGDSEEYILNDPEIRESEWTEVVDNLSADLQEQFQGFLKRYFPSSRVESGNKRRDLLGKLKKKRGKEEVSQTAAHF